MKEKLQNKEQKIKQEKQELFNHIDMLLNDYSNEIPNEIVNSFSEKKESKIRTGWFVGVFDSLQGGQKYFPNDFNLEIQSFFDDFKIWQRTHDLNTKEEVDKADGLLKKAQEYLK